jgi:hypothetical protein
MMRSPSLPRSSFQNDDAAGKRKPWFGGDHAATDHGPTLIACAPQWLHDFSSRGRAGDSDGRGAADPRDGGDRLIGTHLVGKLAEEGPRVAS